MIIIIFSFRLSVLFSQQNRPLNAQNVADALQKFNLKKAAIQKALDNLADGGRISFKEYGKQKVYLARQDQFNIPNNEELNQMKEQNANLQKQLEEKKRAISEVEAGTLNSSCDNQTIALLNVIINCVVYNSFREFETFGDFKTSPLILQFMNMTSLPQRLNHCSQV